MDDETLNNIKKGYIARIEKAKKLYKELENSFDGIMGLSYSKTSIFFKILPQIISNLDHLGIYLDILEIETKGEIMENKKNILSESKVTYSPDSLAVSGTNLDVETIKNWKGPYGSEKEKNNE